MIDLKYAEILFNHLYGNIKGYEVSTKARTASGLDTSNFLYGELPFETAKEIIQKANAKPDGVFVDLGSGTGRVVFEAYLITDFRKAIGVELLEGLHNQACAVKEDFDIHVRPQIAKDLKDRKLEFIKGDIFQFDCREADFIFMNHPIKDSDLLLQFEEKLLNELKPGTKIVTIIRALRNPRFKSLGSQIYQFSWGNSTAHFFEV